MYKSEYEDKASAANAWVDLSFSSGTLHTHDKNMRDEIRFLLS